jgi:hypothetical protein
MMVQFKFVKHDNQGGKQEKIITAATLAEAVKQAKGYPECYLVFPNGRETFVWKEK